MNPITITDWVKLGAAVKDARSARSLTQRALADQANVSRSWLARLEAGHRGVELEPLLRLLSALDLQLILTARSGTDEPAAFGALRSDRDARAKARRESWARARADHHASTVSSPAGAGKHAP